MPSKGKDGLLKNEQNMGPIFLLLYTSDIIDYIWGHCELHYVDTTTFVAFL